MTERNKLTSIERELIDELFSDLIKDSWSDETEKSLLKSTYDKIKQSSIWK